MSKILILSIILLPGDTSVDPEEDHSFYFKIALFNISYFILG